MTPAARWQAALAALAVPPAILDAAPVSPHGFDVALFARAADEALNRSADTPSACRARRALPAGGSVLDVGCGAGAASLPLAPPAALLVGVDEHKGMLAAFAERAAARGVAHLQIAGRWPDAAGEAPVVDVAVCHHVVYNVADIVPFLAALDAAARRGVVVELTEEHPLSWMQPLWRRLHGIERPGGPSAEHLVAVLADLGIRPVVDRWQEPSRFARAEEGDAVAFVRRRLCLPEVRDDEVRRALARHPPPPTRALATLSWAPQTARRP